MKPKKSKRGPKSEPVDPLNRPKGGGKPTEAYKSHYPARVWLIVGGVVMSLAVLGALLSVLIPLVSQGTQSTTTGPFVPGNKYENLRLTVPLYLYPGGAGLVAYAEVGKAMAKTEGRTDVIINPNNGEDAVAPPSAAFLEGLGLIREEAGTHFSISSVYGYVYTSYGARDIELVKAEIDGYADGWASNVGGIFVDEVHNIEAQDAYYAELFAYIKGLGLRGIANCGTNPTAAMAVDTNVDRIVTFEGPVGSWTGFQPSTTQLTSTDPLRWGMMVLVEESEGEIVTRLDEAIDRNYGNVFVSNLGVYHIELPTYFGTEVDILATG